MAEKRGMKRKRNEAPKEKDLGVKIGGKLHHDLKEAKKAAKKAKTFETQKLVKKLKTLRNKNEDHSQITECESELDELKGLNHEAVARTALRSKLLKDRVLAGNEHVQAAISDQLQSNLLSSVTGSTKVQSRILSSKVLAVEIANIIESLRAVILPPADEDAETSEPPRKMTKVEEEEGEEEEEEEAEAGDEMGWESGTVGDDEKENDDGWESGSLDEDGNVDEGNDDTEDRPENPRAKPIASTKGQNKSSAGASTFLPSLSIGFIKGNDDSDWSESDAKAGDIEQKKNRRGQRARRAIWEKKYGKNANHKKQEAMAAATEPSRKRWNASDGGPSNRRYDSRTSRGSTNIVGDGKFKVHDKGSEGQHRQHPDSGWGQRKALSRDGPVAKPDDKKEALHPSWEAKRRLLAKQQVSNIDVQSRKITFS